MALGQRSRPCRSACSGRWRCSGSSFAVLITPLTATVMSSVEENDEGLASGVNNTASRIAQLVGVALRRRSLPRSRPATRSALLLAAVLSAGGAITAAVTVPVEGLRNARANRSAYRRTAGMLSSRPKQAEQFGRAGRNDGEIGFVEALACGRRPRRAPRSLRAPARSRPLRPISPVAKADGCMTAAPRFRPSKARPLPWSRTRRIPSSARRRAGGSAICPIPISRIGSSR